MIPHVQHVIHKHCCGDTEHQLLKQHDFLDLFIWLYMDQGIKPLGIFVGELTDSYVKSVSKVGQYER